MKHWRWIGVAACIALVNACSPYLYKQEIQDFNTQSEKLGSAVELAASTNESDQASKIEIDYQAKQASDNAAIALRLHNSCSGASAIGNDPALEEGQRCAVVAYDPKTQQAGVLEQDPLKPGFAKADEVVAAVDRYTNALVAITDAEDRKALDNAAQELCGAVGVMAGLAGAAVAGPLAAPAGAALCGLATQSYSAWLDYQRLAVLQRGVAEANKEIIPNFGIFLGEVLEEARQRRITQLREIAQIDAAALPGAAQQSRRPGAGTATVAYSPSYNSHFRRLNQIAATLNELETLDARAAPAAFVRAHDALAMAITDRSTQTTAVFQSIRAFGEQAQKLHEAFQPTNG